MAGEAPGHIEFVDKARGDSVRSTNTPSVNSVDSSLNQSLKGSQGYMHQPAVDLIDLTLPVIATATSAKRPYEETKSKQENLIKRKGHHWNSEPNAHCEQAEHHNSTKTIPADLPSGVVSHHSGACGVDFAMIKQWVHEDMNTYGQYLCRSHPDNQNFGNPSFCR